MQTLIAVDLSAPYHEWVVERAIPLATVAGGRVDVGHVGEDTQPTRSRLNTLLRLIPESVRGEVRIEAGPISERLLSWSKELDLLILGPREPSAIERVLRGSVVLKVLRATACPVIIPRKPYHEDTSWRVLVGVDLQGKFRKEVIQMASNWAARFGGRLDAVYAIHDPLPAIGDPELRARAHREWVAAREPERSALQALLQANCVDGTCGQAVVAHGEPEDALGELSSSYDVVVVGNRNREGLTRFLYGAVSQNISWKAHCDVLTLPTANLE
jgi:nucleotide-binding universal stress UspA family protein